MLSNLTDILSTIIFELGYIGIFISTGLEYACFPVSSEILLPFIGYSVAKTGLSFGLSLLSATFGGIVGSFFCYWCGRFMGCFIENTLCKKFITVDKTLNKAKGFFNKHGNGSVLFGRVFPLVRTYISIPAGMSKMPISKFLFFTGIGALVWNTILMGCGYLFGEHWQEVNTIFSENKTLIILILALLIYIVYIIKKKK